MSAESNAFRERSASHTCHAVECGIHVPPRMFMCKKHWYMLPKAMRDAVWDEYVPGQEVRMDPTAEYINVTQRAIKWLGIKEGRVSAEAVGFLIGDLVTGQVADVTRVIRPVNPEEFIPHV